MSRNKALMGALLPLMTLGAIADFGHEPHVRKRHKVSEQKIVGYDHKTHTPEEKFKKWCHKQKIKERRQRKHCRKGGRI